MKAATALVRYQSRELAIRWRSQPASPLARWFLTFSLSAAAGVLLLGFAAAESARRAELRRLGLDTIVMQAPANSPLPDTGSLPPDHWAAPLAAHGDLLLMQQLPDPAFTPWGEPMPVFVAPFSKRGHASYSAVDSTLRSMTPSAEAVWLTRTLPEGRTVRLTRGGLPLTAVTAAPTGDVEALGLDDLVVLPAASTGSADATGRLDVVLFDPASAANAGDTVRAVRRLFATEGVAAPALRDPSPYRAALDAFTRTQNRWRTGMALILCLCVVLAFGSIGMLEEKQTRYTQALLRSLGVSGGSLWSFALVENLILANTALLGALFASRFAARIILELAGAAQTGGLPGGGQPLLWLACAINTGVLLSLTPLAHSLRRQVGVVLP